MIMRLCDDHEVMRLRDDYSTQLDPIASTCFIPHRGHHLMGVN
jgi:hypothetical protein